VLSRESVMAPRLICCRTLDQSLFGAKMWSPKWVNYWILPVAIGLWLLSVILFFYNERFYYSKQAITRWTEPSKP
jgi:hypothetical protein